MRLLKKIPTILGAGGGSWQDNWQPCSYISNENSAIITLRLYVKYYIEMVVADLHNSVGKNICGANSYANRIYANVHITENNLLALRDAEINVPLQDVNLIKWGKYETNNHTRLTINSNENTYQSTNYNTTNDLIDIYAVHYLSGNISNFKIQNLKILNNNILNEYLPYKCITAYDNYTLNEGAFICLDTGDILVSSNANKLVANE